MAMFDKLMELVSQSWDWLKPFEIVLAYEGGVLLRLGKYNKTLSPGLNWKWPLFDYAITCHTVITTMKLPSQMLTTIDNKQVGVGCIIKYKIVKPRDYLLNIWDSQDVLRDIAMGAIKGVITRQTWEELLKAEYDTEGAVLHEVRQECGKFGMRILKVTFTDLGIVKTLRLMTTDSSNLFEDKSHG